MTSVCVCVIGRMGEISPVMRDDGSRCSVPMPAAKRNVERASGGPVSVKPTSSDEASAVGDGWCSLSPKSGTGWTANLMRCSSSSLVRVDAHGHLRLGLARTGATAGRPSKPGGDGGGCGGTATGGGRAFVV